MKLCLNLVHINFVTFMKRIGKMRGVSKHGNEHFTFSAHFSTMGRIKLRQIKVSLHFVHIRPKEKVSCFQFPDPLTFLVSKIFFIHHLIRNHYVTWWSYWVLNLNEERNVVFEDHISFLQSIGIKQTNKTFFLWCLTPLSTIFLLYRGGQCYWWRKRKTRIKSLTCCKSLTNFIT